MTQTITICTVQTMSPDCFKQIDDYLRNFPNLIGKTVEETKANIEKTPRFMSGCFTYLQARAFASYYHSL